MNAAVSALAYVSAWVVAIVAIILMCIIVAVLCAVCIVLLPVSLWDNWMSNRGA